MGPTADPFRGWRAMRLVALGATGCVVFGVSRVEAKPPRPGNGTAAAEPAGQTDKDLPEEAEGAPADTQDAPAGGQDAPAGGQDAPAGGQDAPPGAQVVMAGLRPSSGNYGPTSLIHLREAQNMRQVADGAMRDILNRPIVNHAALNAALGSKYLVAFFDCSGQPSCVARVFLKMRNQASLLVYGDYTVKKRKYFFRVRLIDLAKLKLTGEVEFSLEHAQLMDGATWNRELSTLLSNVPALASSVPEETGDGGDGSGNGNTETAAAGEADPGGSTADDAALDELDAELDEKKGSQGSGQGVLIRRFRGILASEFRSYPRDRELPTNDEQALIEAELELDLRLSGGSSLYFRPRFLIDTLDTDLKRLEPYEGYFQYVGETWDFRLGQFIDNWGIADAYNPLDVLNRRDYGVDATDPVPLGELGAHLRKQWEGTSWLSEPTISLYAMPLWRATELPTDSYRYTFSQGPYVLVHDTSYPDELQDGAFGAVRIEHTLTTGLFSADMQYIGARGPARFPMITPVPQADMSVQLVTDYYGNYIAGGGFRLVPKGDWLSKFTLKTEVVYSRPYRYGDGPAVLPDDYLQYIGGFDRVFNALFTQLDSLTFTVEYLGEYIENKDDFLSVFRPFENDVAGRLYWEAKDFARFSIELRGIVDVKNGELIGEGTIGRQLRFLHDDLRFEVAGQYVRPEREEPGFFAFFPDNSNVRVRMGFNF